MMNISLCPDDCANLISQIKKDSDNWSAYKDIFDARLQTYTLDTQEWLWGAVIGEIGFNTYDHNIVFSGAKGLYCNFEYKENGILLLDFGCGIKSSLSKIRKDIESDKDALRIGFTEVVSGRFPERRGNGLKFALTTVVQNGWNMYFHSGSAYCLVDKDGYIFGDSQYNHCGCFCILER